MYTIVKVTEEKLFILEWIEERVVDEKEEEDEIRPVIQRWGKVERK